MAEPIIKLTRGIPRTDREWNDVFSLLSRFLRVSGNELQIGGDISLPDGSVGTDEMTNLAVTTAKLAADSVTNDKLRDSSAASVIGRASATGGNPADIVSTSDNTFLTRRAGALAWDGITDADIPATIARDSEVTAAITSHEGAANPHPTYLTQSEGDAAYVQLANVLTGSATYDPPSLASGAEASTTVTVTGAALGDFAIASFSLSTQAIKLTAQVTAANTVTVNFHNQTGGTIDLASGTLRARVWKV